jgi:hypothetical protein
VATPASARRQAVAAQLSERPLLVFDFHGRPVRHKPEAPRLAQPPQSIREAVLAWLDQQL